MFGIEAVSRGSEWRKWDLHLHVPGTHLNNNYSGSPDGNLDIDRFCEALEQSDVAAFGLTDYFDLRKFFDVRETFQEKFPESKKLLLPNLELRLNEAVNRATETVDFHLIFRPDISRAQALRFLTELKVEITDASNVRRACIDLEGLDYERATVSRIAIASAIENTFGVDQSEVLRVVKVVPINGNGIRTAGAQRKAQLSDEIDKFSDAFFGNPTNVAHFLSEGRYEDAGSISSPKPVFAGSDAHSFDDLTAWVGKEVDGHNAKNVSWVKADLSWDGFLQTIYEPGERTRMQSEKPDRKDDFKWISSVKFPEGSAFEGEVHLNPNLNCIIGSRSSGKSALLAHIAHAVDPHYTEQRQGGAGSSGPSGPAAGRSWADSAADAASVSWGEAGGVGGKVVYVPQNSLWSMSERPQEIAAQIAPVLQNRFPRAATRIAGLRDSLQLKDDEIREAVRRWWTLTTELNRVRASLSDLGTVEDLERELSTVKDELDLAGGATVDTAELARGSDAESLIKGLRDDAERNRVEEAQLRAFAEMPSLFEAVNCDVVLPSSNLVSGTDLESIVAQWREEMIVFGSGLLRSMLLEGADRQKVERALLSERAVDLERDHAVAIAAKTKADSLSPLLARRSNLQASLTQHEAGAERVRNLELERRQVIALITSASLRKTVLIEEAVEWFATEPAIVEGIQFEIESGVEDDELSALAASFNKTAQTRWVDRAEQSLRLQEIIGHPAEFLDDIYSGKQRLNQGSDAQSLAFAVLTLPESIRLTATLDEDRIGGFAASTMTPGKQALFALRLLLSASEDLWPLLLDQPEDDLDSRAISETIVEDLRSRKRQRQIIVVSHDANVVIASDSEAVIVANRHGVDRPNGNSVLFNYRVGSLEHSELKHAGPDTLNSQGTLQHACEILDGGEKAFQKRWLRYRNGRSA